MRAHLVLALTVALAPLAFAQPAGVTFPVAELGGCESPDACRTYCDAPTHRDECVEFAKAHGMDHSQAPAGVQFPVAELGGCANADACRAYCDDPAHMDACLAFAEAHGIMTPGQIAEARRVMPYLQRGETPGGCTSEAACHAYCNDSAHFEECISFAEKAGLVTSDEAAQARKFGGKGPGDCTSREACDAYCRSNREACVEWALEHGLIPPEEAEMARKFMAAGGVGPGGCTDKESCDAYCGDRSHAEECIEFAHRMGMMSDEEYARAKAMSGGGPGGCMGPEECRAYCASHAEECRAWCDAHAGMCPDAPQDGGSGEGGAPSGNETGPPPGDAGGVPAPCREQNLDRDACMAYCREHGPECGPRPDGG